VSECSSVQEGDRKSEESERHSKEELENPVPVTLRDMRKCSFVLQLSAGNLMHSSPKSAFSTRPVWNDNTRSAEQERHEKHGWRADNGVYDEIVLWNGNLKVDRVHSDKERKVAGSAMKKALCSGRYEVNEARTNHGHGFAPVQCLHGGVVVSYWSTELSAQALARRDPFSILF
jgi:hypothetical protein